MSAKVIKSGERGFLSLLDGREKLDGEEELHEVGLCLKWLAYPYTARWPLTPGEHTFQARVPTTDEASGKVRILVQK
jgi:hypothetical protein